MRLLDKLAFWRKEESKKVSAKEFQQVELAISGLQTTKAGASSFANIINRLDDIYNELDKYRTIEQEIENTEQKMIKGVRAQDRPEVKDLSKDLKRYTDQVNTCRMNIRSLFIKLKVQLDSLQKNSPVTAQQMKEILETTTRNLGNEVRLNPEILNMLLP